MTAVYRMRDYDVTSQPGVSSDELAMPEYQAVCVSGDDADCGQTSGDVGSPDEVGRWMAAHTRDTGHHRYRHAYWVYVTVSPGAWQ
ncbi:hypothetical protein PV516_19615 [Streptomyces scabiei]|uniref:DUF7848 domain-containing protein n=1 Tax=Streptomyces scabiei TaxID=1930 RepID=UPI0029A79C3D|nr:hypothetical protein [Streptomyces scabiei]MDX3165999.1 hypothetical protein [Streptomyces scabiei]